MTFALTALAVSAVLGGITYSTSRTYLTEQRERSARDRAYVNARSVRDQLRAENLDPGVALAGLTPEHDATALVRIDGEWFSSSVALEADDLPREALGQAEASTVAWQRYELRGVPHLALIVPLVAVDALYAEVVPLHELDRTLATLATSLLVGAGVTTLAGAVLGFVAAGRLVRPLRRLAAQAEALAGGSRGPLDGTTDDPELEPLVRALRMLETTSRRAEEGSRFVSDVSHEIRSPLAALAAAVEVMQRRRSQLPQRSADALDLLAEQVREFQHLVVDLLEISRIDAGRAELQCEPTDCAALARAAAQSIGADVPVRVEQSVPDLVLLDRRRIGQVLVNLLENARRYAGGATEIAITRPRRDAIAFAVQDRGPGVPVGERSRIFGRFERGEHGERGPSGSGLGLALLTEHVALHGGRAWVEDGADGGASFVVEVPLCAP